MALRVEKARIADELLEWLWVAEEEGAPLGLSKLLERSGVSKEEWAIAGVVESGLASVSSDETIRLTEAGREHGQRIVRRHRLAERLLVDVLHLSGPLEEAACRFEHAIDQDVAEHICTLLGHPSTCPHGQPIPPGDCCQRHESVVPSLMKRLSELRPGEGGVIAYIAATDASVMERLGAIGIVPGAEISVHQDQPSVVLHIGATRVALDLETVGSIYARVKAKSAATGVGSGSRPRFRFWSGGRQ